MSDYSMAINIDSGDLQAYNNRVIIYYKLGEYDKAWLDVHKVEELGGSVNPKYLSALKNDTGRDR